MIRFVNTQTGKTVMTEKDSGEVELHLEEDQKKKDLKDQEEKKKKDKEK